MMISVVATTSPSYLKSYNLSIVKDSLMEKLKNANWKVFKILCEQNLLQDPQTIDKNINIYRKQIYRKNVNLETKQGELFLKSFTN